MSSFYCQYFFPILTFPFSNLYSLSILSLLVGSLLVGRQIVDRAKIQRIIFEFDYYEKAFHQFYDTYRVVPGNIDLKTCQKYADMRNNINCSNHVLTKNTSEEQHIAVCYDKRTDEVDKSIYHSNINLKFGCNVMYVLELVK
ncbi:MAG: hypothetical protein IJ590_01250 [Rickettsiales bacterium]|nr:hypothetical protein [Rickettsiales bacterium]